MHNLLEQEKLKYRKAWQTANYRGNCCGVKFIQSFVDQFRPKPNETGLDLGCGSGRAGKELQRWGLTPTGIDLVDDGFTSDYELIQAPIWQLPNRQWTLTFCSDVLEHIPETQIMLSLSEVARVTHRGVFFSISTRLDNTGPLIGEVLHVTVHDLEWWQPRLEQFFISQKVHYDPMSCEIYYWGIPK
jgi:ubiquinone/menaquinone biosynthesis C-methylase UbiE